MSFDKPVHRLICNEVAIDYILKGFDVWTEFEVKRCLAPVPEIVCRGRLKVPDVVAQIGHVQTWIEVENAFKSKRRLAELVCVADTILEDRDPNVAAADAQNVAWGAMEFVAADPKRLVAVVRAFDDAVDAHEFQYEKLRYVSVSLARISPGYVWKDPPASISIDKFLYTLHTQLTYQRKLRYFFDNSPVDPSSLTHEELADCMASILEAKAYDLDALSESLQAQIQSYDQLRKFLRDNPRRLNRDIVARFIREEQKVMSANIGLNADYLSRIINDW